MVCIRLLLLALQEGGHSTFPLGHRLTSTLHIQPSPSFLLGQSLLQLLRPSHFSPLSFITDGTYTLILYTTYLFQSFLTGRSSPSRCCTAQVSCPLLVLAAVAAAAAALLSSPVPRWTSCRIGMGMGMVLHGYSMGTAYG
jgi:hypothetical protein